MSVKSDTIRTLRGGQRFLNDLTFPRLLETRVIASEIFKGRFELATPPELPAGCFLLAAPDIPGLNTMTGNREDLPLLAPGVIRYKEQPLALAVGEDLEALLRLARALTVTYHEEVPQLSLDTTHPAAGGETLTCEHGQPARAFKRPGKTVSGEYASDFQEFGFLVPPTAVAVWEKNVLTVFCPTRHPFHVRENVALVLSVPPERVCIVVPDSIEDPGDNETLPTLIASLAALAAFHTKRGVRVTMESSIKLQPALIRLSTRLTARGTIAGTRAEVYMDAGAAALRTPDLFHRAVYALPGPYQHPALSLSGRALITNKTPYARFLSGGVTEAFCAMELHISRLARAAGLDPFAFRKQNLFHPSSHSPREQKQLQAVHSIIDAAARASDFSRKHAASQALRTHGSGAQDLVSPLRGVGSALTFNGFDFIEEKETKERHSVTLTLEKDGSLRILTSALEMGQALKTLLTAIAARTLEINPDNVTIDRLDTTRVPDSGPMYETHALTVIGRLIEQACVLLRKKKSASRKAVTVTKTDAGARSRGTRARTGFHSADAPALSWCATVVEVDIDPATYRVLVRGVWTAIDSGVILNRDIACAQVEREVRRALETAAYSPFVHRHKSVLREGFPPLTITFTETPYPYGPLGAKGLGELPALGVIPAWLAAVSQALGRDVSHFPLSAAEIADMMEET